MRIAIAIAVLLLAAAPAAAGQRTATFSVPDMTCPLCPVTVATAIKRLDGIVSVSTDVDAKTATVVFDAGKTSTAAIAAASTNAGYAAALVKEQ
ncbi:heavy-metal-associated domain-containing protein [Mesorhizobium sp. VK23B]|uniref:Heavy-metal-associated domain-containing protein n=1 Tax=Mesorhizobium dulcispinae TaxID=3072316 RepID=A0ABU4XAZ5_9HYPH|nr:MULTISPECIES: heavy-metal-associated domain-containing protein [unclassified Mesorhizobium]MDX8466149.1 heavy-metal-associated domain-containing protein [Mesorhizobium sp. VK23B]MDX8471960.1 heavy-metal-associated domain-containing protein [Mesorhizobium sp. VK23A]MDX8517447.1 heavy-metal-associated domain-containing protein [Mesorhizobium sp. VK23D]